jgi:hypothetical protein
MAAWMAAVSFVAPSPGHFTKFISIKQSSLTTFCSKSLDVAEENPVLRVEVGIRSVAKDVRKPPSGIRVQRVLALSEDVIADFIITIQRSFDIVHRYRPFSPDILCGLEGW